MSGALNMGQCVRMLFASGVGTGVLVLPYTMSSVGWGLFAVLMTLGWIACTLTTTVLFMATAHVQDKVQGRIRMFDQLKESMLRDCENNVVDYVSKDVCDDANDEFASMKQTQISYGDLVAAISGKTWIVHLLDITILLECLGVGVAYLIFLASFLRELPFWSMEETPTLGIIALAVCPFMLGDSVGALCHLSSFSLAAFLAVVAIVVSETPAYAAHRAMPLQQIGDPSKIPEALCVCVFAYFWHSNVPMIATQLHNPTPVRCLMVSSLASLLVTCVYLAISVGGYYSFGSATSGSIIDMYPEKDLVLTVLRLALSASVFAATVMALLPTRGSLLALLHAHAEALAPTGPRGQQCLGLGLVGLCFVAAAFAPGIISIVRLLGGTLATLLMIVYPAIIARLVLSSSVAFLFAMVSFPLSLVLLAAGLGVLG